MFLHEVATNFGKESYIEILSLNPHPQFRYYSLIVIESSNKNKRAKVVARIVIDRSQFTEKYLVIGDHPRCKGKCISLQDENLISSVGGQPKDWLKTTKYIVKAVVLIGSNTNILIPARELPEGSRFGVFYLEDMQDMFENVKNSVIDSIVIRGTKGPLKMEHLDSWIGKPWIKPSKKVKTLYKEEPFNNEEMRQATRDIMAT